MLRYLAFRWDPANERAAATANSIVCRIQAQLPDWATSLTAPGLRIFHRQTRPTALTALLLPEDRGVIFGTLFDAASDAGNTGPRSAMSAAEGDRILQTGGQSLIDNYWGKYVAFLADSKRDELRILRDPSEGLPCYYTSFKGVHAFFSDIEDAAQLHLLPGSVNWSFVHAYLMYHRMQVRETGWEDVYELQGGECLTLSQQGEDRAFLWAPQRFCDTWKFEDPTVAANELRSVVHACLISWGSTYDKIVERLSGGFDSAVLLSGLRRRLNPSQIICANNITPGRRGDERDYARSAAAFSGCELVEQVLDPSDVCIADNIEMLTTSRPSFYVESGYDIRGMASFAQERCADVIMTGNGGDQLFYNSPTPFPVADYFWRRHGLWRPIGTTKDRAIAIKSTIPAILADAFRYGVRKQPHDPYQEWFQDAPFLNKEALRAVDKDRFKHPWIKGADGIPPGKVDHILGVVDSQHFYHDPLDGRQFIDVVHPLISQPIFELCLAIPSYVLASGRSDRGLARQAFAKDVPPKILNRHIKGTFTQYFLEVFSHNAEFIREFLLDGELVGQKLILRDEIEPILMGHQLISSEYSFPLSSCIATEAWLRNVPNATV
ncbi:MAG: hypothetical protein GY877_02690 [Hyphomicrobium sp.]|nr:hypothetical protein [Hyphomicrobium sp.]